MSERLQIPKKPSIAPARSLMPAAAPFRTLQRKCACGSSGSAGGECAECSKRKLQRSAAGPEIAPPIVHDVLRSPGQSLDAGTRAYFEPRLGHDFSKVRVHTDSRAAESAQAVNALAYTVGRQIVFSAGRYQPGAASGKRLLAHELTHVMQQSGTSGLAASLPVGRTDSHHESEANQTASAILANRPSAPVAHAKSSSVQRDTPPQTPAPAPTPSPSSAPPTSPPAPGPAASKLCPKLPAATPASCVDRHNAYCDAQKCVPGNSWLRCVCNVSGQICDGVDALEFKGAEGSLLQACAWASSAPPKPIHDKGDWFLKTNQCIWEHWRNAFEAVNDPSVPVPSGLTPQWAAAVTTCRKDGIASSNCCKAHVKAEQSAIDACGGYPSATLGTSPAYVPGAPNCSKIASKLAPGPPFTGDFGSVSDRIKYGNLVCKC